MTSYPNLHRHVNFLRKGAWVLIHIGYHLNELIDRYFPLPGKIRKQSEREREREREREEKKKKKEKRENTVIENILIIYHEKEKPLCKVDA